MKNTKRVKEELLSQADGEKTMDGQRRIDVIA